MLNKILKDAKSIAIGGHVRPDGDCVGSCVGLYQYIKDNYNDKKAEIYLEKFPESFKCLKGTSDIRHEIPADVKYDQQRRVCAGRLYRAGCKFYFRTGV